MAIFTSDTVDRINSIENSKIRSYLYKLNEDLTYMFNNLTVEDNFSELSRLIYAQDRDNIAQLEIRADGIDLRVSEADTKIANLTVQANGIAASVTNSNANYNSSMQLLANLFSLGVNTPSGSSNMVLTGDKITLTTGKFLVNAKNLTIDANGNATFSGTVSGSKIKGATISGGSINIGDGFFEVDSDGSIQLGDFYISSDASNVFSSNDGTFKITMELNLGDGKYYPKLEMDGLSSRGDMTIYNGQITGAYCISADYFDGDIANKTSYFYDICLGKSWWKGWTITETVQDLWEQVEALSDETVKYNIIPIDADEAHTFIMNSNPVTFQYKKDGKWSAGMIAQEVDALEDSLEIYYPIVKTDKKSEKYRIEYQAYIPLLIATVQNLQNQINELRGDANETE